ncbi:exodeoxyribonuclease III [Candidatus Woesearchaeota archaeon]|nr:exodeoxyribonuclease III [Candidatus Woesearchaeota archaeon]
MKIISWNVAGINACIRKGLLEFIRKQNADVYCFQEVKSSPKELSDKLKNYNEFWFPAKKKGYSGTLIYSKQKPKSVKKGIGADNEGRVITLEFPKFYLINAYFPHAHRKLTRLDFKLKFNRKFQSYCEKIKKKKPVIIAADFNVAHKEIDLANPKQNQKNAGFTIQERNWFDNFLKKGYIDTFRQFTKEGGHYTWWTYMFDARKRNIGWRIDYFVVTKNLKNKVKSSKILKNVMGSDHAPIKLEISL